MIPFNKPYLTGKELEYIEAAVKKGKISGNGDFTKKTQSFFENKYGFKKALLTNSATAALEMAAILLNLQAGDEVIIPSFTFVSTALAFDRAGAKVIFADSSSVNPNIDVDKIEDLISERTKAIVVVHYAGISVDMDEIIKLSNKYNLHIVEDAAQAIESTYKGKFLGGLGHLAAFSFHETKNIISGEGGMLIVNEEKFKDRAEIIWEKGTNRAAFFRGEIDKYNWVDTGSSFLPSELTSAFLYAQLENIGDIQDKRREIWFKYFNSFKGLEDQGKVQLPIVPQYSSNNYHIFYLLCKNLDQRTRLINFLKAQDIMAVFHYSSLHSSQYYQKRTNFKDTGLDLFFSDKYSETLLRLPLYYELNSNEQDYIIKNVEEFFKDE